MSNFEKEVEELKQIIINTYESGTSLDEAEKLAARFLAAQMFVSEKLQVADLDARMKKTGTKAIKASVYMEAATSSEKKPSDVWLQALVDKSPIVQSEQDKYDEAEVGKDYLVNLLDIFKNAHVYYRGIAKGQFNG